MSSTQSTDSSRDIHSTLYYLETANYHSNFSDYCNRWINKWYPEEKTVQIRTSEIGIVLLKRTFNPAKNQTVVLFQHSSYLWIGYFYGLLARHGSLQGSIFFLLHSFSPRRRRSCLLWSGMGFHDLLKQSKTRVWLWYVPLSLPYCFFSIWRLLRGEIRNLLFLLNCYRGNLEIEDPPIPCYSLIWQKGGLIEIQTFRVLSSSCL